MKIQVDKIKFDRADRILRRLSQKKNSKSKRLIFEKSKNFFLIIFLKYYSIQIVFNTFRKNYDILCILSDENSIFARFSQTAITLEILKILSKFFCKSFLLGQRIMSDKNFYLMKMVQFRFARTLTSLIHQFK